MKKAKRANAPKAPAANKGYDSNARTLGGALVGIGIGFVAYQLGVTPLAATFAAVLVAIGFPMCVSGRWIW